MFPVPARPEPARRLSAASPQPASLPAGIRTEETQRSQEPGAFPLRNPNRMVVAARAPRLLPQEQQRA